MNAVVLASILTIIYITVITVLGELNHSLKDFLAKTFSHHWIGKDITAIVVFLIFTLLFTVYQPKIKSAFLVQLLSWLTLICTLLILGFFIRENTR